VAHPELEHRLAAILSADAVGYTRGMAEDEAATIRAIGGARRLFGESAARHRGRVVDAPGDAVLAEFPSALDAMRCAVDVQRALAERAAGAQAERRLAFRIGLHLGDVAVEGERIYGDGVNVAARLQALAEPGGICLSSAVHDIVGSRLDYAFHDLGEQTLKNFPRPVRAFRLGGASGGSAATPPSAPAERVSLVVLPFANVSGDAEQEYFADGMTEDLIAELARLPEVLVIGRGTSFAYKGKSIDARALGRELGVRHVVEGSVRRAGARVRISARLSDAQSGHEVWSERFDRELGDVFALQDEVVGGVVAQLRSALGTGIAHAPRERTVRPEVWALLVQGRAQIEANTVPSVRASRELLERCVALDPELAPAWAERARSEATIFFFGLEGEETLARAFEHARRALALDPNDPDAHAALGFAQSMRGEDDASLASIRRAVELAPGRADLRLRLATGLVLIGRAEEGIRLLKQLQRLDPAQRYMHLFQLALAYRRIGRIDEAIAKHRECLALSPDFFGAHMNLAGIYVDTGDWNLARAALAHVRRLRPDFTIAGIPRVPRGRDWLVTNLRALGVPES